MSNRAPTRSAHQGSGFTGTAGAPSARAIALVIPSPSSAYRALLERTGDRCGTVRLAGRSVGASFVGAVASTLVVAELLRLAMGAHRYEIFGCHLRDVDCRSVVRGDPWPGFNPGSLRVAA